MKVTVLSSLLLMLGMSSPLFAIERPPSPDEDTPKEEASIRAVQGAEPEGMPQVDQAAAAWLGIFGESADEALAAQLGVDGGVVLRYVAEGSPADEAGLKVHDLLTSIDGEGVSNQDGLRAIVRERKPGDEVQMGIVSRGVQSEKTVKLGERPAALMQMARDPRFQNPEGAPPGDLLPDLRRQMEQLDQIFPKDGELQKQMENQMKRMEKQLKELEGMPGFRMEMQLDEMLKDLPKQKNGFNFNLKALGSVELLDDQGSVKMKMRDGGKEVEVRDKAGELLYDGPWDTEQDKAAVAPEIRERIERIDENSIHLNFHQVPRPDPDEEPKDAEEDGAVAPEEKVPGEVVPEEKAGADELE